MLTGVAFPNEFCVIGESEQATSKYDAFAYCGVSQSNLIVVVFTAVAVRFITGGTVGVGGGVMILSVVADANAGSDFTLPVFTRRMPK